MIDIRNTFNSGGLSRSEVFEVYGPAASKAARTLDFQELGQKVLADAKLVTYEVEPGKFSAAAGRPQLHAPPPRADGNKQQTDGDMFTWLMAMLGELFGEVDASKLKSRLAIAQNIAAYKQQALGHVSDEYIAAVAALEAAEGAVGGSQQNLEKLRERVQHFQGLLEESEARLAGLDPESPEYARELAIRDQLKGELTGHTQTFQKATDAHLKLIEIANAAAKTVTVMTDRLLEAAKLSDPAIKNAQEKALSSSAQALLHRLKIIELLGDAAQNKEELNQELYLDLQAKLQESMRRESERYLEEVRKAEAMQKTMGCIGKIVGALVSIALIATGVGVAAGVIGLAVMATDIIVKETTGFSIMGELMKPLTAVMQEAIKLFGDLYSKVFGEEAGKIMGMVAGIVATLAALALAVIVGAQVLGPIISAVASKLTSTMTQLAPQVMNLLNQAASVVGKSVTQALVNLRSFLARGSDPVSLARYTARVETALALTEFGGVAAQGVFGVRSGVHQAQAAEHLAEVRIRTAISEQITTFLTLLVDEYGTATRDKHRQIEQIFADMQRSHSVSLNMVRHI